MNKKVVWTGRVLSILVSLQFGWSAVVKLFPAQLYPEMAEGMAKIGLPESILGTVAFLEIMCIVAYAIPMTAVLGAILFTGYLGGAMLAHLRIGDSVVIHIVLGVLLWLGVYLREPRLHALIPVRKKT